MTSFVKSQIASYLERIVKNFERDQLKLSLTKGRFELKDLEFDADLLTSLAELPTWMKLSKVSCNRLYVKIGWRKIQSLPLHIHLDEVQVVVETCKELRVPSPPVSLFSVPNIPVPEMKYRLPHKIIDGMVITMNTLRIAFATSLMKADIQLLQLRTYPSTPEWQETDHIAKGRVKNSDLDETLIFRQVEFESMRMELASIGANENDSRPITIVTNNDSVRVVIKRRLSDATVLAVKVDNLLDNIQMALSETEMKSAVDFVRDIMMMVESSTAQTRILKAQHKYVTKQNSAKMMKAFMKKHIGEELSEQLEKRPHIKDARARYYMRHNIWESSQHLLFKAIDVMILHDNAMPESVPEYRQYARYADASMLFHIDNIRVDAYPFHLVSENTNNWMNRHHTVPGSEVWIDALLGGYRRELSSVNSSGSFDEDFNALMSTTIVAGIGNMTIYPVNTAKDVHSGNKPNELPFLSFQKAEFGIPDSVPAIEMSRTQYYYAKDVQWPVPKANLFVSVSPMRVSLDPKTVDWMTLMGLHVSLDLVKHLQSLEKYMLGSPEPSTMKTLMRVEVYFPRIFFPKSFNNRQERGSGIQIQMASMVITNTSVGQTKFVDEALPKLLQTNLYANPTFFPNMSADWSLPQLIQHVRSFSQDPARRPSMMCIEVTDMWAGAVSDELGTSIPLPFLDAFSMRMWLVPGNFDVSQRRKLVWGAAIVELDTATVRVQVNEYILKLLMDVSEGIMKLGEVGGEHMSMLPKLGCPNLGLCMLMQQENVEMSLVLQSEYGQNISAGDALNISNLSIAKEAALSASDTASLSSLSTAGGSSRSMDPQLLPDHGGRSGTGAGRLSAPYREPEPNVNVARRSGGTAAGSAAGRPSERVLPVSDTAWWKSSKYLASVDDEDDVEGDDVSQMSANDTETGYASDDDVSLASMIDDSGVDTDVELMNEFSLAKIQRKRVPLAEVPTSLLCITLKSLQTYMMMSHGHLLVKLRMGQIVTAESHDVSLRDFSNVPLQEGDLDVSRPEYMDTVLVRFEQGAFSLHGDAPGIMAVIRGINVIVGGESVRRAQALMAGLTAGGGSSGSGVGKEPAALMGPVRADSFKMAAVPMIDVRLMNVQCKLKDVVEAVGGQGAGARDLTFRVSGLTVQSSADGVITVSSVRDEELDEDEEAALPSTRLIKRQLSVLNERKAKLEMRIRQLQGRMDSAGPLAH